MEKYNCAETFPDDGEELSLLDILIVLAEQKKLIVAITLLFAVAGFGYTAFMKKDPAPVYKSEVQMVAEELRYVMGDGELSLYRPADMIKAVVASRSMRDAVLEEFPTDNKNDITIAVNVNSDKLITISVTSPSAELSMKASDFIYRKADAMLLALCAPAGGEKFPDNKRDGKAKRWEKGRRDIAHAPDMPLPPMLEYDMLSRGDNGGFRGRQNMLQLVSPASVPDEPMPQPRECGKVIVLATLLGFFCAVTAAFARHFWAAADDPETTEKKNYLKKLLGFKPKA